MAQRLLIISNRLPVSVEKRKKGLVFEPSVGGLATGLGSFYKSYHSIWIGWPGIASERLQGKEDEVREKLKAESCHPVFLSERAVDDYYHGFCNKTIWPLFHYFPLYTEYNRETWEAYRRVNETFASAVLEIAKWGDIIWVHDYQLMLLPKLIRDKLPGATIGYFLHIPFPSSEILRLLPWRSEILEGLLGSDLVGFHTYDYTRHFVESVRNLLGYDASMGQITAGERTIRADVFPMGIDYERYSGAVQNRKVQMQREKFLDRAAGNKLIISVDRLDYTKGILQRLEAFDLFLTRNQAHKEKLVLVLVVVPSRTRVEDYALLKRKVDELVGAINGKHGSIGWMPIWYMYRSLPFDSLVALYSAADVALVTPIRDGMNLIAKEYIATKADGKGVLILSETAGAAQELGEAITINVHNQDEIVRALEQALTMTEEEQIERNISMQKRLERYNVKRWAEEFIDRLLYSRKLQLQMEARALSEGIEAKLITDYQTSSRRLLLLDYDGTLIPFSGKPGRAKPGDEILELLRELSGVPQNEVVVISGRDKDTLDKWLGSLNIGLVAEHGVWVRERGGEWQMIEALSNEWKKEVRPILELWADRTPGSFIEEKGYSLVWHYRKAGFELGTLRARELVNVLLNLTGNLNLQVLEGSKVIEVKNSGINKGRAASRWVSKEDWGFILAVGDDWTDEDIFKSLPAKAWSIKVRFSATAAKFNIGQPSEVRALLRKMLVS